MKKPKENICKFVTATVSSPIETVNFVYETKALACGKTQINQNNIIYIVTNGKGRLRTEFCDSPLEKGTLFFTFSGNPYCIDNLSELEYIFIAFRGKRCDELFLRFGVSKTVCAISGFSGLITFWQSALGKATVKNLDLISESVLLYTFSQMTQNDGNGVKNLADEIVCHIEAHFSDSNLTLEAAADSLGYNSKYISRIFTQTIGTTFSEYLKTTRIKHAVFLMEQGVTVVKNVALLSGFSDPLYFSKVFRQEVGVTPSEFIETQNAQSKMQN